MLSHNVEDDVLKQVSKTASARADVSKGASYLLIMTSLIYTFNIVDRSILGILSQSIKVDLSLSDAELGVLGGIAFALLYAGLGIPAARLAERYSRVSILSGAIALWSMATIACGMAANFIQLALARSGVGLGEAACAPCSHSMIADSFPPERRAVAMSYYSLAVPAGAFLGIVVGAWIAENYSWRWAFIAAGIPGLVLAVIAQFTIKEPRRGQFDVQVSDEAPGYAEVLRYLLRRKTFVHMAIAVMLNVMVTHAIGAFLPPLLLRGPFGLNLSEMAMMFAIISTSTIFLGIYLGGVLANKLAAANPRWNMYIPAIGMLIAAPVTAWSLHQPTALAMLCLWGAANVGVMAYMGPCYGSLANIAPARMRASAIATMTLFTSVLGLGLGPVVVGLLSDLNAVSQYAGNFALDCGGGARSKSCMDASFAGLRDALVFITLGLAWGGVHFFLASRSICSDLLAAKNHQAVREQHQGVAAV